MKKRHLENCLSKERRAFESDVKKYKRLAEIERENSGNSENSIIIESVPGVTESFIYDAEASTSASGQQTILSNNQQAIATTFESMGASIVSNPETKAMSNVLMECKVAIKKVERSVCRLTGENVDKHLEEVARMLPLHTREAVQVVEQKLDTPDFAQAMTTYLQKVKGTSEDAGSVIRATFTDDLLHNYNWEGSWGQLALPKLILMTKILRDVFQQQAAFAFKKSLKRRWNGATTD